MNQQLAEQNSVVIMDLETYAGIPAGSEESDGVPRPVSFRAMTPHTECFTCSHTYFDTVLDECTRCGSKALQYFTSEELDLFRQHTGRDPRPAALRTRLTPEDD